MFIPKLDFINYNELMRTLNRLDDSDELTQSTLRQFLETDFSKVKRFTERRFKRTKNVSAAYREMAAKLLITASTIDDISNKTNQRLIQQPTSTAKRYFEQNGINVPISVLDVE